MADHWYDNDSTLGLGLGMIMLSRRYARQQAAEAPYKEAEFAAWWAGLTPAQQDAYNASLKRQQQARPARPVPTAAERKRNRRIYGLVGVFIVALLMIPGLWNVAQGCGFSSQDCQGEKQWERIERECGAYGDIGYDACEERIIYGR